MTVIIMFGCLKSQFDINKQLTFRLEQFFLHSLGMILIAQGLHANKNIAIVINI